MSEEEEKIEMTEENTEEKTAEQKLTGWAAFREKRRIKKEIKRKKEEAKSFAQNFFETVLYIAVMVLIALLIKTYIGQPVIVSGNSMNDTLNNLNFVWANKIGYKPERFDVVIVRSQKTQENLYIKRIIAMPGETVYVNSDDEIFITPADGGERYKLDDPYGYFNGPKKSQMIRANTNTFSNVKSIEGDEGYSYVCGDDEYFVMGDNRYDSSDSRVLGAFKRSEVKEHAVFRIWPLNKLGDFDKSNEKNK